MAQVLSPKDKKAKIDDLIDKINFVKSEIAEKTVELELKKKEKGKLD